MRATRIEYAALLAAAFAGACLLAASVTIGALLALAAVPLAAGEVSRLYERDGRVIGSNFLDERSTIAGIGPVSVDPPVMNGTIGRRLMQAVLARAAERGAPGVRLLQVAWHYRSLALYTKLGFEIRETVSALQGSPL